MQMDFRGIPWWIHAVHEHFSTHFSWIVLCYALGLMRSETMSYLRVLIPSEAAFAFVDELGKHDVMEFVDVRYRFCCRQSAALHRLVQFSYSRQSHIVYETRWYCLST